MKLKKYVKLCLDKILVFQDIILEYILASLIKKIQIYYYLVDGIIEYLFGI